MCSVLIFACVPPLEQIAIGVLRSKMPFGSAQRLGIVETQCIKYFAYIVLNKKK